ncbi:unnamed protein product [Microthlaspi erraticum]|nr:unnamed protein product [Microthlaspi erraticum]
MYSADGSIPCQSLRKHARSLYLAADKYEIPHLRDICRKELISSLNPSNAVSILELAQIPLDIVLHHCAFAVVRSNFNTIAYSDKFKSFAINYPDLAVEIMKSYLTSSKSRKICSYCGSRCRSCCNY